MVIILVRMRDICENDNLFKATCRLAKEKSLYFNKTLVILLSFRKLFCVSAL